MRAGDLFSCYDFFSILVLLLGMVLGMGWKEMRLNSQFDTHENASEIGAIWNTAET
jgi:lipopolysaccharide biosynthesis regulator YciM